MQDYWVHMFCKTYYYDLFLWLSEDVQIFVTPFYVLWRYYLFKNVKKLDHCLIILNAKPIFTHYQMFQCLLETEWELGCFNDKFSWYLKAIIWKLLKSLPHLLQKKWKMKNCTCLFSRLCDVQRNSWTEASLVRSLTGAAQDAQVEIEQVHCKPHRRNLLLMQRYVSRNTKGKHI